MRNHRVARSQGRPLCNGLIITGASSLPQHVVAALEECDIPCIAVANLVGSGAGGRSWLAAFGRCCATRHVGTTPCEELRTQALPPPPPAPAPAPAPQNNDKAMLTYNILAKITDFTRKMDDSEPYVRRLR